MKSERQKMLAGELYNPWIPSSSLPEIARATCARR